MMGYWVKCEKTNEGRGGPNEVLCTVLGYGSFREGGESKAQVFADRSLVREIDGLKYLEVGVIPNYVMPNKKPLKIDVFLIEFPQPALNGSSRVWVRESDLIELAE